MTTAQIEKALKITGQVATIVLKATEKNLPGALAASVDLATTLESPRAATLLGEVKTFLPFLLGGMAIPRPSFGVAK